MTSRFVASTSVTALRRIRAQSSSVRGLFSTVPSRLMVVDTESHSTSALGSITESMISLTVAVTRTAGSASAAGAGLDDEHAAATHRSPTTATTYALRITSPLLWPLLATAPAGLV